MDADVWNPQESTSLLHYLLIMIPFYVNIDLVGYLSLPAKTFTVVPGQVRIQILTWLEFPHVLLGALKVHSWAPSHIKPPTPSLSLRYKLEGTGMITDIKIASPVLGASSGLRKPQPQPILSQHSPLEPLGFSRALDTTWKAFCHLKTKQRAMKTLSVAFVCM